MIGFYKTSATAQNTAHALLTCLKWNLGVCKRRTLWLVSGGSNIRLTVEVLDQIPDELRPNLAIMLNDERYGKVGHKDSNMLQLEKAGFNPGKATVVPVLVPDLSLEQTTKRYESAVKVAFDNAEAIVGQFGMGPDGHIAGVLPSSAAVNSKDLVASYKAEKFTRITLTPKALKKLDAAYVYVFGDEKKNALQNLQDKNLPLDKQPAQLLKKLPNTYVYNDQIGSSE